MNIDFLIILIIPLTFLIYLFFRLHKHILELKSFKKNAYKIKVKITGCNSKSSHGGYIKYSPIYNYIDKNLGCVYLSSDVYTIKQPVIGETEEVYYNPEYPKKCYSSIHRLNRVVLIDIYSILIDLLIVIQLATILIQI